MELKVAIRNAAPLTKYVDGLNLRKWSADGFKNILLLHRVWNKRDGDEHTLHIVYSDDSGVHQETFPMGQEVDFAKLPGLNPLEEGWKLSYENLFALNAEMARFKELVSQFEEDKSWKN